MARRRKRRTKSIRLANEVEAVVKGLEDEMQEAMKEAAGKAAEVLASTLKRELYNAGLRPSAETGSADKQSARTRSIHSQYQGSMLDIEPSVVESVSNTGKVKYTARGRSPENDWRLNFWVKRDPETQQLWGEESHQTISELTGIDARGADAKALRLAVPDCNDIFKKAIDKVVKNSKQSKHKDL